jgi:hypothetical protein
MAARSMVRLSFLVASAVALLNDKLSLTPLCRLPSKKLPAYVAVVAGYSYGHITVGYVVPLAFAARISQWTYWRAQLFLILLTLGFVPLVDLWAPSLATSRRLEAPYFALRILVVATQGIQRCFLGDGRPLPADFVEKLAE